MSTRLRGPCACARSIGSQKWKTLGFERKAELALQYHARAPGPLHYPRPSPHCSKCARESSENIRTGFEQAFRVDLSPGGCRHARFFIPCTGSEWATARAPPRVRNRTRRARSPASVASLSVSRLASSQISGTRMIASRRHRDHYAGTLARQAEAAAQPARARSGTPPSRPPARVHDVKRCFASASKKKFLREMALG